MWTLVYSDTVGLEHFERFESRIHLKSFIDRHELAADEDILIFPPDTEMLYSELYE